MRAKRNPAHTSKRTKEQTKSARAFKTAAPLVVTTLLLGLVYVFVLTPVKPINVLKSAFYNTFDFEKQKSLRYDGSFGDDENDIKAEYNGQKASNGDKTFSFKITHNETSSTVFDYGLVGSTSYINLAGTDNITTILGAIPGAKPIDPDILSAIKTVDDKWISLSGDEPGVVSTLLPCAEEVANVLENRVGDDHSEFPFEIVAGPYAAADGSSAQVFEVKFKDDRKVGVMEQSMNSAISCLDGLRGDDYRLREVNDKDIDTFRLKITVDPLSNTINHIQYKQFGSYFQVFLRDFNKDVTVTIPPNPISLNEALNLIPVADRLKLLQNASQ